VPPPQLSPSPVLFADKCQVLYLVTILQKGEKKRKGDVSGPTFAQKEQHQKKRKDYNCTDGRAA
jgi:hypothetical protein